MHMPPKRRMLDREKAGFLQELMHELQAHAHTREEMQEVMEAGEYILGHPEECQRINILAEVRAILRRDGQKWQYALNTFTDIEVCRFARYPQFTPIHVESSTHSFERSALDLIGDDERDAVTKAMEIAAGDHGWVLHAGCHHDDDHKQEGVPDQLADLDADLMASEMATDIEAWLKSQ